MRMANGERIPYTTQQGLPSNFVTALAVQTPDEDAVNDAELLWVGTEAGLVSFDGHGVSLNP